MPPISLATNGVILTSPLPTHRLWFSVRPGANTLPSQGLRSRSSYSWSIKPRPERGFFGKLFLVIRSLVLFEILFSTITSVWNLVHSKHVTNTVRAQLGLDKIYWDHHSNEWAQKNNVARLRMKAAVAFLEPELFTQEFILTEKEGTHERNRMIVVLKQFNPKYYDKVRDRLGDVDVLNDFDILSEKEDIEDVDIYLFGPKKSGETGKSKFQKRSRESIMKTSISIPIMPNHMHQ